MEQEKRWRWMYRDPATGRIRTDGWMTEDDAQRYPEAVRISEWGGHESGDALDFQDTLPEHFRSGHALGD